MLALELSRELIVHNQVAHVRVAQGLSIKRSRSSKGFSQKEQDDGLAHADDGSDSVSAHKYLQGQYCEVNNPTRAANTKPKMLRKRKTIAP